MSEESEVSYEQDEVLWAKVCGYPWWPAFVDRVHSSKSGETEYTVLFFGDSTYSKLGASKLKKFCDYYADFYPLALTNRRLMSSIQMAEEKLSQNNQDISIFEEIRQEIKNEKETHVRRKKSRTSLGKDQSDEVQLPIINSLSFRNLENSTVSTEGRVTRSSAVKEEKVEKSIEYIKDKEKKKKKEDKISSGKKQKKLNCSNKKDPRVSSEEEQSKRPAKKQLKAKKLYRKIRNLRQLNHNKSSSEEESQKSQSPRQSSQKHSTQKDFDERKLRKALRSQAKERSSSQSSSSQKSIPPPVPRKRGRPRKIAPSNQEEPEKKVPQPQPIRQNIKRERSPSARFIEPTSTTFSEEDFLTIERTRQFLSRREELIEHLANASITTSNVQEILEMGVATILEEGERTKKVEEILAILKKILVHKFFPGDVNPKQKSDKIRKNQPAVQPKTEVTEKEKPVTEEQSTIRKKTISKLQKFLKTSHSATQAKELSIKIESHFYQADSSIQEKYRKIAFNVLCVIKEGKESTEEVLKKIETHAYD